MTTTAIRKKLMNFIAEADDKKVKGMYMLFEEEIEKEDGLSSLANISKSWMRKGINT